MSCKNCIQHLSYVCVWIVEIPLLNMDNACLRLILQLFDFDRKGGGGGGCGGPGVYRHNLYCFLRA
jgi:hypothetical protein